MPCYTPVRANPMANSRCPDENPSCPRPPHNLSYCKDWAERISDVKFWQSTTNADFAPPKSRSVPNLLPCLDGRIYTRTQIGEPTGTALTSLYKISASHRDYKPPPGLRQKYPSTEGYREPWKTVLCRWCGSSKPSEQCSSGRCGGSPAPSDPGLPLYTVIGMYTDSSRENDPRCSPCLPGNQIVAVPPPPVDQDRLGPVCPTQRSNLEPVRTPAWSESITRYDFKSPHGPATVAKRAEKQSYYQRFMADMCASAHILDRVAEFGSLGGSITQYQDDFCQRLPSQELQDRYRILVGCPPLTGNNVLSPYSTCGKSCNI
ncbi:uncharacterized protein LOC122372768 isoform X1 [Amphibalanus amphitrite]|uniref:uncharacterized protein LOC122372768 isoform X1 n=1 Tax=Amphibalanus amphitrite TaxID=1232801 RepID=UPI001C9239CE|nr:uncharacterized protein LOC122372768 isoform X1 [Amphibalanus amphitrite]